MSHSKIRTEKVCLNCGTDTPGRFCPACGQENIEPKQSVWHLVNHFFSDITHFDGKFFITVKDLFAKPGFLSKEYMMGRRASYLDPIRMYIFTSAIFFLITFSLFNVKNLHFGESSVTPVQNSQELKNLLSKAVSNEDSVKILNAYLSASSSSIRFREDSSRNPAGVNVSLEGTNYHSVAAYDSAQKTLPAGKRDGWMRRRINIKTIELNQRFSREGTGLFREMIGSFLHNFPKALFISLPAFALILKLLYFRRKEYYYVDHGIFTVHLYIFSFLVLLILLGVSTFQNYSGWRWLDWIILLVTLYPLVYYYKAMRNFYGQGRKKTVLKYILLFILSFFVQLIIFLGVILFTVYES